MVIFIVGLLAFFYFQYEQKLMLSHERSRLIKYANSQTKQIKELHEDFPFFDEYPRDVRFKSAIYDLEYVKIFSLLESEKVYFDQEVYVVDGVIHYIKVFEDYYLGAKYLVIEIKQNALWYNSMWNHLVLYSVGTFLLFLLFGVYLAKLFIKPMQESIELLDRFIKDTTHELNTPLSAILANIELMDTHVMVAANKKKLERINIAARTVSCLYQDLTYLTLEQYKENQDEVIDLKALLETRSEYFRILAESKGLQCKMEMAPITLYIDRRKITRVIDNLISNAIKYSKRGGNIFIYLEEGVLSISDEGVGMSSEEVESMFERYKRFNNSEGGFGVGLDIVKKIATEYGFRIEVESEKHVGTTVRLRW
jgi:two-component system OmpR family sensor kinase